MRITRAPAVVLEEARQAARALKDVIDAKPKRVVFNGETYLEFEDWQMLGRFYGVTAKVVSTAFVEYASVRGFAARAVALRADGAEIGAAEAECLNDEAKWRSRPIYEWRDKPGGGGRARMKIGDEPVPLFQLKSMAQTRAAAKALRGVLSWVVMLAGYRPTPAEELSVEPLATPTEFTPRPRAPKPKGGTKTRAAIPAPTVYRTDLRPASVEPSATVLETGAFGPALIANVEARQKSDGTPWWLITTTAGDSLYTLDSTTARELGGFAGSDHELRLKWELTQAGDRRRHHLLHVEPVASDDIAF